MRSRPLQLLLLRLQPHLQLLEGSTAELMGKAPVKVKTKCVPFVSHSKILSVPCTFGMGIVTLKRQLTTAQSSAVPAKTVKLISDLDLVFDRVPKSRCSTACLGDFLGVDRRRVLARRWGKMKLLTFNSHILYTTTTAASRA